MRHGDASSRAWDTGSSCCRRLPQPSDSILFLSKRCPRRSQAAGIEPASKDLRKERRRATSVARARFPGSALGREDRIVLFGKQAEVFGDGAVKGALIQVEGSLQTRDWTDRDGNKRYTTETVARLVQVLGKREHPVTEPPASEEPRTPPEGEIPEEDIPFQDSSNQRVSPEQKRSGLFLARQRSDQSPLCNSAILLAASSQ